MNRYIVLTVLISVLSVSAVFGQASDILLKVDNTVFSIKDKTADVEMVMVNLKTNKEKVKKAEFFQKGLDRKLFRYTYPESDKGIATLTIPNQVYLYLPMFKKPKRITNLAEGNAFNKSDFSLEDMNTKFYSELYTPELLETNTTNYILKLAPKNEMSYSYLIITVNKSTYCFDKVEFYNIKGEKSKVAVHKYIKIDNSWVTSSVSMTDLKKNHMTKFIMTNIKINTGLSDDLFTVENMVK